MDLAVAVCVCVHVCESMYTHLLKYVINMRAGFGSCIHELKRRNAARCNTTLEVPHLCTPYAAHTICCMQWPLFTVPMTTCKSYPVILWSR